MGALRFQQAVALSHIVTKRTRGRDLRVCDPPDVSCGLL